ncbi:hypothetical protein P7H50_02185 [Enterococcus durans]|uniref:hypothetical protein n=1 Tax=Enterococcus durans TaxID=53345 RepID=UPI002892068F|nr:hypothetical protein [Enterococcus durans]MDT2835699.1 hypothetical protein [Enterococcus durans]
MSKIKGIILICLNFLIIVFSEYAFADIAISERGQNRTMTKKLTIEETINEVSQTFFIDSNVPLTETEKHELLEKLNERRRQLLPRATGVALTYFIIRSGNTTNCELLTRFNATSPIKTLWWDQVKVQNMNLINKQTYATFRSVLRSLTVDRYGTERIGYLSIPLGETRGDVTTTGTMVESMKDGWEP